MTYFGIKCMFGNHPLLNVKFILFLKSNRSQKLVFSNANWELGPELYMKKPMEGACIVQVSLILQKKLAVGLKMGYWAKCKKIRVLG